MIATHFRYGCRMLAAGDACLPLEMLLVFPATRAAARGIFTGLLLYDCLHCRCLTDFCITAPTAAHSNMRSGPSVKDCDEFRNACVLRTTS